MKYLLMAILMISMPAHAICTQFSDYLYCDDEFDTVNAEEEEDTTPIIIDEYIYYRGLRSYYDYKLTLLESEAPFETDVYLGYLILFDFKVYKR